MLNPTLYNQLVMAVRSGVLPGGEVVVANHGMQMQATREFDAITGKYKSVIHSRGETYQICCPGCGDSRHRLWINHRWNTVDPTTGKTRLSLLKCFNEDCQEDFKFVLALRDKLELMLACKPKVVMGEPVKADLDGPLQEVELPGEIVPLSRLPAEHPAIQFLLRRGYDLARLEGDWGVCWCENSRHRFARGRIVFPVRQDGKLVGWQARYVGKTAGVANSHACQYCGYECSPGKGGSKECPNCRVGRLLYIPKYFTCPGMSKSRILMNLDAARFWPYCVIVEGPMDVTRVGTPERPFVPGPTVASLGHDLSVWQRQVVRDLWGHRGIILLYDPDVYDKTKLLAETLWRYGCRKVVPVRLPDGVDPGDADHKLLWELIRLECRENGVSIESLSDNG